MYAYLGDGVSQDRKNLRAYYIHLHSNKVSHAFYKVVTINNNFFIVVKMMEHKVIFNIENSCISVSGIEKL